MKKIKYWSLLVISLAILGVIYCNPALAYRPFGVEDAGVAGAGVSQLETSWDYLKWGDGKLENILLFVPIHGVTDNLELSAEIPYLFHKLSDGAIHRGIGDINLVAKYLLINESKKYPAFTFKGAYKLDSGDFANGLGSGDKDYSIFAVISKTIGNFSLHSQLGYSWLGKNKNPNLRDIPLYGIAVDWCVNKSLGIELELNGNRHPDSTETDDPKAWLLGVIYKLSDKIILDCASRWGLSKSSPIWSTTTGVSITF